MNKYLFVFFIGVILSFVMTPLAKKLAHQVGAIDVPKDERRVHKKPIPRMGGLAIYLGVVGSILLGFKIFGIASVVEKSISEQQVIVHQIKGMLLGGTLIVLMGIVDDIKPLPAKVKLFVQIISALVLVVFGMTIKSINIPFMEAAIELKLLSIPITIFWIVGITNTLNLIDGLDGLAAGVATIAAFSLSYVAFVNGREITAIMTLAIAGACIGFLPYNFNPAKIFMGDTGSLFLGYMLAAISIHGLVKGATAIATVVPVLALGLPIFDTTFAILRRLLNGRPIMEADKGHLHHKLLSTGMGQKRTVLILYAISSTFGISAALMSKSKTWDSLFVIIAASALMYISMGMQSVRKQKSGNKE
ncbi:MraY family glycosyltransferase [Marinisporobacter balticus]|uniref:UDP-GlcNAc:undecaprenyl-phosphate GlcNAc-1-phosphate transferase n=1 Tax=Marinisporobacter balticus TaxID=2018667 RepID=A0A4R2L498_9FIRM|nr:MraY family glycosyltransferase [Marinisporobacter balticus]TCO78789.1 UDP-GlcNAc:undecaprenyl-phosphate GlcNAc-1-phosphate transferase [Marinisporobacter balticus]